MTRLKLRLLGPFQAELDGKLLENFRSAKIRSLLAYFSIEPRKLFTREFLADIFWPDYPENKARSNLRNAIWNLRREIGEFKPGVPFILSKNSLVQFNPKAEIWVDVKEFYELIESACDKSEQLLVNQRIQKIKLALSLYQGRFIEDLFISSQVFETWKEKNRLQIQQKRIKALQFISMTCFNAGKLERALSWSQNWINLDPWDEKACRLNMKILADLGYRSAAINQFNEFRNRLIEDLGIEPQVETLRLYQAIELGNEGKAHIHRVETATINPIENIEPEPPPNYLVNAIKQQEETFTFFARDKELRHLDSWLHKALIGKGQVGMIIGESGSGKTFLINAFVRQSLEKYPDLLIFNSLCTAYFGQGDQYFPFITIIRMLAGELTSLVPSTFINSEHLERLCGCLPDMQSCLLDHGSGLIERFLSANYANLLIKEKPGRIQKQKPFLNDPFEMTIPNHVVKFPINDQFTQVLDCLSRKYPLLIIIDDLHLIDQGSTSLLFHFGRQIHGKKILLLGAFRPDEISANEDQYQNPFWGIYQEFKTIFGDITLNLKESDGEAFIRALLLSEPNEFKETFYQQLYQHTSGNPLLTIELLRGMQMRKEIIHDRHGKWIEGNHLDWEKLPTRVEAAIGRRMSMLPRSCIPLLALASVQGYIFDVNIIALVLGKSEREIFTLLNEIVCKKFQLITMYGIFEAGERSITCFRFKHELFQVYLYNQLNPFEKIRLHKQVGQAIEELYQIHIDQYPKIGQALIQHFEIADQMGEDG